MSEEVRQEFRPGFKMLLLIFDIWIRINAEPYLREITYIQFVY